VTPQQRIAEAVRVYPGTLTHIAAEAGISRARLCTYIAGDPGGAGYAPPTDETALVVVGAVRTLLASALASLPD
jgi:hypothetical protein